MVRIRVRVRLRARVRPGKPSTMVAGMPSRIPFLR